MTFEERHERHCRLWLVAITLLHAIALYLLVRPMPEPAFDYAAMSSFASLVDDGGPHVVG